MTKIKAIKTYFGGKIKHTCWRHKMFPGLRGAAISSEELLSDKKGESSYSSGGNCRPLRWQSKADSNFLLEYTGPYFISCDHGCYHGDTRHGVAACNEWELELSYPQDSTLTITDSFRYPDVMPNLAEYLDPSIVKSLESLGGCGALAPDIVSRKDTIEVCRKWLNSSDLMIVWADKQFHTAHGTHAEMGMAAQAGIPIYLMVHDKVTIADRLKWWFPAGLSTLNCQAVSPEEGLEILAILHSNLSEK